MAPPGKPGSEPPAAKLATIARQLAMAMELPIVLLASIMTGGLLGYGLDYWLHTRPICMLIGGGLGFVAGIRELLRRLSKSDA